MPKVAPIALSLIVCDGVHIDPSSGKRYVLGGYSHLSLPRLPALVVHLVVAFELTGGRGQSELLARVVWEGSGPLEERTLIERHQSVYFSTVNALVGGEFDVSGFAVRHPGKIRIELWSDGAFVAQRSVSV